jgi:hypothetical protein
MNRAGDETGGEGEGGGRPCAGGSTAIRPPTMAGGATRKGWHSKAH